MKIAFLGPTGTFSHVAATELSEGTDELVPCETISDVFRMVRGGNAAAGVVPFQNPGIGLVAATEAEWSDEHFRKTSEIDVPVSFAALSRPGDSDFDQVVSHPAALAQCTSFIAKNRLQQVPAASTAAAAANLGARQIAIAPVLCAELYHLNILERTIEDTSGQSTRFIKFELR